MGDVCSYAVCSGVEMCRPDARRIQKTKKKLTGLKTGHYKRKNAG